MAKKEDDINLTDEFTQIIESEFGLPCVKEYRFHPTRRWRFDYAIEKKKIAIEIDGGIWIYGRHNHASGILKDMEKFNEAAALGWRVLKFTPEQQYRQETLELIGRTIDGRKRKELLKK